MSKKLFYFESEESIEDIVKSIFDMDIALDGGWGYGQSDAIVIKEKDINIKQLEHTIASMRTHLEMNITQKATQRYGGINLTEISRSELQEDGGYYEKVTYKITAILEHQYNDFIEEYKEQYGQKDFDISDYFRRRKAATNEREETLWFLVNHKPAC